MKHVIRYVIVLAVMAGALFFWNRTAPAYDAGDISWITLLFFTVVYAASHMYISASEDGKPAVFVRRFMAVTSLRFMLFMIVLVAYTFTHREKAVLFISHFLAFYFVFTTIEVATFYRRFSSRK